MNFKYIIFFILLLVLKDASAQNNIRFNHLSVKDGLSHSAVTCILQDKKGFMWFGTQDGLNRYDGYSFKVFKNDPDDSLSLKDNFIYSIYENRFGILYIETQSGIFHKYLPETETFETVSENDISLTVARYNTAKAMLIEASGTIWKGGSSKSTGLIRQEKNGKTTVYKHSSSDPFSLSDDKVYSVFRDSRNNLWIGTFNGLDKLDEKTGKFIHYRNAAGNPYSIADNWVWPVYEDANNNLWIGTVRGGLSRYDYNSDRFYNYKNEPADQATINDNYIFSIYQDRSGVLWIGTNAGGINFFHQSTQAFEHYLNKPGENNSISGNDILSIHADNIGSYWIGTRSGLNKFDYNKKIFKRYLHSPSNNNSISTNSILSIYKDRSEILWLGNFNGGLDAFDEQTGKFKHYKNNPADPNSLSDNRIMSIIEDREGYIWIGTYGGGLNKLDKKTDKIVRYQHNENDKSSISSNAAWSIIEDKSGLLWIGTFGGGVNIFNKQTGTFTSLKNNPNDPASLTDNNVIRIYEDSKENIWIGTTKGLTKYDKNKKSFTNFREKNGLANDFVYGILEDASGYLWISTNNGISRFNQQSKRFKNYYYDNGLQGNEFNQNAFAKDFWTGRLLFGGINGLTVFHPNKLQESRQAPPLVFTDFTRYNTDDKEGKPIQEKGISVRNKIILTYKDNIVTLNFAALNFKNSRNNQYKYKLEGFNKNWIQLGNNHSITFTNLSQGNYNLKVIGSNSDGIWNERGVNLAVEVLPPWWRTRLAYIFYGITFVSILYGLRRFELSRREAKAKIRETELRIKATEAEKRAIQAENDRKTKELEEARQLQLSMLPKELPKLPGLDIAAFMRTATEVGGDYYDFLVKDDKTLNVGFGDATGHGLQAGTMVTLMKGFFTSDAARLDLADFMNHCSRMIKDINLGRILMSFSLMRIENDSLLISSGGMPPVFYFDYETKCVEEIIVQGMPLGAMRKFNYKTIEKRIKSGDTILLLTDGLPEQMNKSQEMFEYSRVKDCFTKFAGENPREIINELMRCGDEWMDGSAQADDISFVVLKVN